MKSNFELQRLSAFLDEALDPSQQLEIQAELRASARLRAELHALRMVRGAVRTRTTRHALPAGLARRIKDGGLAMPTDEIGKRKRARVAAISRHWFQWQSAVATMAVAGLSASGFQSSVTRSAGEERLMEAAVTSHLRATTEPRLMDVASADQGTVIKWLTARLATRRATGSGICAAQEQCPRGVSGSHRSPGVSKCTACSRWTRAARKTRRAMET